MVREFEDAFFEELFGLPPVREVDFGINLEWGIAPISKAPYETTSTKLKELMKQHQEILDKGFIWPIVSLWVAPMLFMEKKNGTYNCV